jgi:hypothetical protein
MKRTTNLLLAALAMIAALQANAFAQVGPEMRQIKTSTGLTLISNVPSDYFRMLITGRNASRVHTPKRYWYTTDGVRFEFFSEENSTFVMTDVPTLPDRTILGLYRSDYIRRNDGENLKLRSSWLRLANNKTALIWTSTTRPAAPTPMVEKQIYVLIATPMRIYGLLAPVQKGQTEGEVRGVLTRVLGTLTFSDEPTNISAISK